jgi:hypothetical protein
MSEYDEFDVDDNDDSSLEDSVSSVPDPFSDSDTESEASEPESVGVVWVRGKNGKLERS